ncbi:DUF6602 domain-containing protein [Mariniflexile maritimum]|uniref:DUF6602 domain-containing protein n=1 Tax=Mariniflexile maritimum TaxID=2682493 RepID=UPI0012F64872|nr:DUF6602 domain-containing protein [Mariniflexile maritimum]
MNAVIGSIIENLRSIQIIYEPTVEIFKGDRTNTGDSKEISVNEFIQSYLTNDYRVKKGKIYSLDSESANIDCVVLAPNHPNLITPKREVILAEGVFCAIEVKPDITSLSKTSEFVRSTKQIKSIKNLNRKVDRLNLKILGNVEKPAYFDKIPAVLFSKKSADFNKIIEHFRHKVKAEELKKDELPDIIFSIENGVLFYCPHFKHTSYYKMLSEPQKLLFADATFMQVSSQDKEEHINLLIFLIMLLNLEKPHIPISDFFIKQYLQNKNFKTNYKFMTLEGETERLINNPEMAKKLAELLKTKK